jgi:hypothetical protein
MKIRSTRLLAVDSPTRAARRSRRGQALSHQPPDVKFARGEVGEPRRDPEPGRRPPHERLDKSAGDGGSEPSVALGDVADGGGELAAAGRS